MTREEEIKQAAYSRYAIVSSPVVFKAQCNCFIESAKWADKTMIGKACDWLKNHLDEFWVSHFDDDKAFIEAFKKAMEE